MGAEFHGRLRTTPGRSFGAGSSMLATRSDGRTDGHRIRCALSPRCSDARRWSLLSGPRAAPRQARRRSISSHGLVTARAVSVQLLGCCTTRRSTARTRPWIRTRIGCRRRFYLHSCWLQLLQLTDGNPWHRTPSRCLFGACWLDFRVAIQRRGAARSYVRRWQRRTVMRDCGTSSFKAAAVARPFGLRPER
jgi:hypothetical protein